MNSGIIHQIQAFDEGERLPQCEAIPSYGPLDSVPSISETGSSYSGRRPICSEIGIPIGTPYQVRLEGMMIVRKVTRHLAKRNRYVIRVTGDSMKPRLHHDDLILVDTTVEPRSGKTVLAMLNGKTTV